MEPTPSPAAVAQVHPYGNLADGRPAQIFTLANDHLAATFSDFGARLLSLKVAGHYVVLGYPTLAAYEADTSTYMGAIVGRFANRIAQGTFPIDGAIIHIAPNNGANALHGGLDGFDRRIWSAALIPNGVAFTLISPDGDQGFPGELTVTARYTLAGSMLRIDYEATTTAPTVVNLTNHAYFNLAGSGDGPGPITDHVLHLAAAHYTPIDASLIPTGELAPVAQTPFDFRTPTSIAPAIHASNPQLARARGFDHNWVIDTLDGAPDALKLAAVLSAPNTTRTLTIRTTEPGIQFYSGNFLTGVPLPNTSAHVPAFRTGLCLETQHFPDSPNHPEWPTTTLLPGQTMRSTTTYTFTL